jgi:hypothetical protein
MSYKERADQAQKSGNLKNLKVTVHVLEKEGDSVAGTLLQIKRIPTRTKEKSSNLFVFETDKGKQGYMFGKYAEVLLNEKENIGRDFYIIRGKRVKPEKGNEYTEYEVYEL